MIAAPLKLLDRGITVGQVDVFPRSDDRGPIEALAGAVLAADHH